MQICVILFWGSHKQKCLNVEMFFIENNKNVANVTATYYNLAVFVDYSLTIIALGVSKHN